MTTVSVRSIVDDVDAAIAFYTRHLGFAVGLRFRNEIVGGMGGRQILLEGPSGNPSNCSNPHDATGTSG
jgi:catechol 2,3-dioxygenase-like lactoylglutathione lyase family enzyme